MVELPERFGRYTILARLGGGGMGSVYLAEDTILGRKVALKVAHLGDGDTTAIVERFRREARAAAGLNHPNLCHVYDFGEIDGVHFLSMAYIEGDSLAELIHWRRGITPRSAVEIVRTLALALAEAHARGVIHRDLKPSNVMMRDLGSRREPVIVDFGLARRDDPTERRLTRTGQVFGTPHYMPPEQVRGEPQSMGPACDIYALGVILYELLTGRTPFDGPNAVAIMAQILTQDPSPPSMLVPGLDPRLELLCLSAIARDPRSRPASMSEFAATLDTIVNPASIPSPSSLFPSDPGAVGHPAPANHTTISDPPGHARDVVPAPPPTTGNRPDSAPPVKAPVPKPSPTPPAPAGPQITPILSRWKLFLLGLGALLIVVFLVSISGKKGDDAVMTTPSTPSTMATPSAGRIHPQEPSPKVMPAAPPADPPKADRRDESPPKEITSPATGLVLVRIEPGEFDMGSGVDDKEAESDEKPRHHVRITKPFYLGKYEVTRGQFRKFVEDTGYKTEGEKDGTGAYGWDAEKKGFHQDSKYTWRNPGFEQADDHPVVCVSWNDAVAFCKWLSEKEGVTYRLPTEAEWEYACRAGSTTRYSCGDEPEGLARVGNVADGTAKERFPDWTTIQAPDGYVFTAPVGQFQRNAFGLFDMHGNVWEWCSDRYAADYYHQAPSPVDDPQGPSDEKASHRVLRGGGWGGDPRYCRSANRDGGEPAGRINDLGFRVARVQVGG
ncbi:MAG TPA: bifunctional serine/threonine-protein kinase/formylglycine-generating enzyme family protein [Isosphaeraceae bacterium]|jgi:formylglycine-generating enzyme required for sulfatase activity/predicted Ser/Thr protein kinase|nr:bifunctional serine/threonine-protein kinase/formylglycine-generating enzyme family protein [Isosphaeraceae bacterium]